ncbi:MAG: MFS transporter [Saprospiraceae bacterium]
MTKFSRTVWVLSLVSLLADFASEMLYPVMPVFLNHIGFSVALIGLLEGMAEATAGLSKGYFGQMSDRRGERVPFVRWGYFLSAVAKPLMVVWAWPLWVFAVRTLDRLGKGLRTGARDAMLSAESTPETKAQVFGFHRSMDTFGAVLGPLVALAYLHFRPGDYTTLFVLAFGPGLLSVAATLFLRGETARGETARGETARGETARGETARGEGFFSFLTYWKSSTPAYRRLVLCLLAFAVFNSSDAFLLLKMKSAGATDVEVIGAYIFYNLVFALAAWPMGILADKLGMKRVFLVGLVLFAFIYLGFALVTSLSAFYALFFLYGLYAAATDGVAKAWLTSLCNKKDAATAVGFYAGWQSVAALAASLLAGVLWQFFGAVAPFAVSAFAVAGVLGFMALRLPRHVHEP